MAAYYNEHDKFAAAWLRELIRRDVIAPGEVDERDIQQVTADDIRGFTQCHFFAGIGVWSHAMRSAGWPDANRVWTGSCPCQPFSVSGTRKAAQDGRHLWPVWFPLIRECGAVTIFGEQVASDDGLAWLDLVSSDLENAGYACGAVDTCAAGFGAPQISQRLYFVAEAASERCGETRPDGGRSAQRIGDGGESNGLATAERDGRRPDQSGRETQRRIIDQRDSTTGDVGTSSVTGLEGHAGHGGNGDESGRHGTQPNRPTTEAGASGIMGAPEVGRFAVRGRPSGNDGQCLQPGATNGFWSGAEWIPCRDGKARPVESGTFPLAHGAPARVGRLRGYGNALVAPQAIEFIKAYLSLQSK